ncbi:MAG: hypothetical protein AB7L66_16915 [Gemmatimonadales bacterium]
MIPLLLQVAAAVGGVVHGRVAPQLRPVVELVAAADSGTAEPTTDTVTIDQRDLSFVPTMAVVPVGATVRFRNSDPILHNVFSPPGPGPGFNLGTYPQGDGRTHRFDEPGVAVILCHVHPEMVAYVFAIRSRWFAVADAAGRWDIPDVPPGRYLLRVWPGRGRPVERRITVPADRRLEVDLDLTQRSGRH